MDNLELLHHHHDHNCDHDHNIEYIYSQLQRVSNFSVVAEILKNFSDPTRVRIIWLLSHQEECVNNIAALMDMSSPAISHHLRSLSQCGLIVSRRDGKEVYYKAADTEIGDLLHKGIEKIMEISCPEDLSDSHNSKENLIENIRKYMIEHLSERITIEELARKFLTNTTTLKTTFKDTYGETVAVYMKKKRMEEAVKLLENTDKSIAEIAGMVGYDSQSRFTTAFKDIYEMLPTEYRKKKNVQFT